MDINIDIKEQKGNPGFNPITSNRSPIKYQSTQNPGFLKTKQKKKRKKLIKLVSKNIKKKKTKIKFLMKKPKKAKILKRKITKEREPRWESGRI